MRLSFRALPILIAFGALPAPANALPRLYTPRPYAVTLGCSITFAPRPVTNHKVLASYEVHVVDTLDHALVAGTAIQYGVTFSDGTAQNATGSLATAVAAGQSEFVGSFTPPMAPQSCTAGIPPAQGYVPPAPGGGGPVHISSSPKPVVHQI